jgi:multisubunit Na+/H+ antiporter MnhG subunit
MPAVSIFFVVFVAFALLAPLALYALVRAEGEEGEPMDRASAERVARQDTTEDDG